MNKESKSSALRSEKMPFNPSPCARTLDLEAKGYTDEYIEHAQDEVDHVLNHGELQAAETAYLRRLNYIVLPTISACYFFEYLDRGNVAVS